MFNNHHLCQWISLSVLALSVGISTIAAASVDTSALEEAIAIIDDCAAADMAEKKVPGAALALVIDGELVYERGYGVKHHQQRGLVDANTLFRIASVNKMMTAAAVMTQVEHGLVALNKSVIEWIPELQLAGPWRTKDITVAHLLTHMAAIPDVEAEQCPEQDTLSKWVASLEEVALFAPPGSFWNYSNAGYDLAGLVVERASGRPYHRFMREQIWEPADMMATFPLPSDAISYGNYSYGHEMIPESSVVESYAPNDYSCEWSGPSGTDAFSTAGDLARWAMLLMQGGGTLLKASSVRTMQARHVATQQFSGLDYGYGIYADIYQGIDIRFHSGSVTGWSSFLLWAPKEQFAVAVLSNGGIDTELDFTAHCALETVLETELEPSPDTAYITDPAAWERYRGGYLIRNYSPVEGSQMGFAYVDVVSDQLEVSSFGLSDFEVDVFHATQQHLDHFLIDSDAEGNALPIAVPITFIEQLMRPGKRTMWLRARNFVGQRIFHTDLSGEQLISSFYRNMFDRDPEPAGLNFYLDLMEQWRQLWRDAHGGSNEGASEYALSRIALDVLNGAQGDDLEALTGENRRLPVTVHPPTNFGRHKMRFLVQSLRRLGRQAQLLLSPRDRRHLRDQRHLRDRRYPRNRGHSQNSPHIQAR